ncbi:glycosyltransferase [Candidatus Bathyarchaeota archaeon]|nr:glycosyltransferase [Candidatus Bathyarchaeota archaeon]
MKEAIITHPSLNRAGGAERVCISTIKALRDGGYKVKLFTIEKTDWHNLKFRFGETAKPYEERFLIKHVPGRDELSQALSIVPLYLSMLMYNKTKHNFMINTQGDLVSTIADICYVNAVPQRIAYQYSLNKHQNFSWMRVSAKAYDLYLRAVEKVFKNNILLVNSNFTRKVVKRYLRRDSIIVYPPVEVDEFRRTEDFNDREDIIVTTARFRKWKHLNIIPKIAKLVGTGRFIVMGIVDEASNQVVEELKKAIQALGVSNRIQLLINQPRKRYLEVLKSAKVYLHTQPMEAFGISIVEAMASGCIPLVPQNGGPWLDILDCKQGVYGFSYSSISEAAAIITKILKSEQLRRGITLNATRKAQEFSSTNFEKRMLKIVNYIYKCKNHFNSTLSK